jgi:hypothetical protein
MNSGIETNEILSYDEARQAVKAHGLSWNEFIQDIGTADEYEGGAVLKWLGYLTDHQDFDVAKTNGCQYDRHQ